MIYCRNGHAKTPDNVYKDGKCKICVRLKNKKWAENNPDKKREIEARRDKSKRKVHSDRWRINNKEKMSQIQRNWYERNRERQRERHQKIYLEQGDKIRLQNKIWRSNNKSKMMAYTRKYQSSKLNRTPKWLTKEQLSVIEGFYIWAQKMTEMTGIKHHVDHIVPLQGKSVSGLHVPWNLQILTAAENISKHNNFVPGRVSA